MVSFGGNSKDVKWGVGEIFRDGECCEWCWYEFFFGVY